MDKKVGIRTYPINGKFIHKLTIVGRVSSLCSPMCIMLCVWTNWCWDLSLTAIFSRENSQSAAPPFTRAHMAPHLLHNNTELPRHGVGSRGVNGGSRRFHSGTLVRNYHNQHVALRIFANQTLSVMIFAFVSQFHIYLPCLCLQVLWNLYKPSLTALVGSDK